MNRNGGRGPAMSQFRSADPLERRPSGGDRVGSGCGDGGPVGDRHGGGDPIQSRAESSDPAASRYRQGDRVLVRAHFPPGHARAPWYTRGHTGEVVRITGPFPNAEERAYGRTGAPEPLYRVRFRQHDLWPDYAGGADDTLVADIYEHWLEPGDRQ